MSPVRLISIHIKEERNRRRYYERSLWAQLKREGDIRKTRLEKHRTKHSATNPQVIAIFELLLASVSNRSQVQNHSYEIMEINTQIKLISM